MNINDYDDLKQAKTDLERNLYEEAIVRARWNQSQAAKLLGVSRGTLRYKLKAYFGNKYIA